MKLETLHIYGYGKLKNVELHLSPVTILYGENEAGKSTIRSFIKSILFGFPSRRHRYEPKEGGAYGGAITATTKQHGRIRIERLPRTTTGEVTVYFEDGTQGGEGELKKLLEGLDVSLFDSIFCFDMHGLQNIHQVKKEELGSYLFSAGAVGTDKLLRLEKKLDREMESLFKPNGRKPSINVALQDVNKMSDSLHKWQQKLGMYEEWQQKGRECEERVADIQKEKETCKYMMKDYETMITLQPLLIERQKHEDFLATLSQVSFPAKGVLRYEKLLAAWKPVQLRIHELSEKIENGKKTIASLTVNTSLLEKESLLEECRLQKAAYIHAQQELDMLKHSSGQMKQDIETLQSNIGIKGDASFFLQLDTSLAAKEHITEIVQQSKRLEEQKKQLDDRFSYSKEELEEQEEKVHQIHEKLQSAKKRSASSNETSSKTKWKFDRSILLLAASLAVLIIGLVTKEVVYAVIFLCTAVVLLYPRGKTKNTKTEQDIELRQLADRETFKLQQIEKAYDRIVKQFEEWEQQSYQLDKQIHLWKKKYTFSDSFSYNYLLTAFERIEKIKQIYRELMKAEKRKERLETEVIQYDRKLTELRTSFSLQDTQLENSLYMMNDMLKKEQRSVQDKKKLLEKFAEWEEECKELIQKCESFQDEQNSLFKAANVHTEEEFFTAGNLYEEKQNTRKHLSFLETQIQLLQERLQNIDISRRVTWTQDYSKLLNQQTIKWNDLQQEEQQLQQNIAKYRVEIEGLEEGNSYSDILHEWEAKKSVAREKMKQWAAYALAKEVLLKTKDHYHQVRLPRMLETAQKHFQFMTKDRYVKIFAPTHENSFIVERENGVRFSAHELSQATAEQLYLSLRFSLADTFDKTFPLIIDDSFVHFDTDRTERTMELLRLLSNTRQIIFFTCHPQFLSYFDKDEAIRLEEKRNVI